MILKSIRLGCVQSRVVRIDVFSSYNRRIMVVSNRRTVLPKMTEFRLAWIGSENGACDVVLDRFLQSCEQLGYAPNIYKANQLNLNDLADRERIVLVANNRADYPVDAIAQLTTRPNIVPWAVVTNSWYIGSRRSGQGAIAHWQQPWFRWWDSWIGWFFPDVARPGSVMHNAFSPVVTYSDHAMPHGLAISPSTHHKLLVLCACRQTAELLSLQTKHAGWTAHVFHSVHDLLRSEYVQVGHMPELMLWDDSLLACLPNANSAESVDDLVGRLVQLIPASRLIASVDLQHLDLWPLVQKRGCVELLVKPSHALALSNLLFFRSSPKHLSTSTRSIQDQVTPDAAKEH